MLSFLLCFAIPAPVFAETDDIYAEADAAQQQVEQTASDYEAAVERLQEVNDAIDQNQQRIAELESQLPAQQSKSDNAICSLYKMQNEGGSLIDLLLNAQDFGDFLKKIDYLVCLQDRNLREIKALQEMRSELAQTEADLASQQQEAQSQKDAAEEALAAAQEAREAAQKAAEEAREAEEAARKAEEEAAAKAAEEAAAQEAAEEEDSSSSEESITTPTSDDADWSTDKETFVSAWSGRLDSYLSGSPLAGYGATFAAAAWDYGIDPRFSAAISCVESSKGAYCFRSHNAWGWGSVSWDSWEEAIAAHARGLARGYGYTVSESGAKKYCPGNWEHWYNRVCEEMAKI